MDTDILWPERKAARYLLHGTRRSPGDPGAGKAVTWSRILGTGVNPASVKRN